MNHTQHNQIANFIWSIDDAILRVVHPRSKCQDIKAFYRILLAGYAIQPLHCVAEIAEEIMQKGTEGLLSEIIS